MPRLKVPFGLKEGRFVGTDEVDRGLDCGCICPQCRDDLIAKKGEILAAHFAHRANTACSFSPESALHLAAKQILVEGKAFAVPALDATASAEDQASGVKASSTKTLPGRLIHFSDVQAEIGLGDTVADIYAVYQGRPFVIEIAVTHFCDATKKARLASIGLPAVEVDLSSMPLGITMAALRQRVVESAEGKSWLHNPRLAALEKDAQDEATRLLAQKLAAEVRRQENKKKWRMKFRSSSCNEKLASALDRLRINEAELPAYLDQPTRGNGAFSCPRRVWQAAVFAAFIQGKPVGGSFTLEQMHGWLAECFDIDEPFPNAVKVALWDFLCALEAVGCVARVHKQSYMIWQSSVASIAEMLNCPTTITRRPAPDEASRKRRINDAWQLPLSAVLGWAQEWREDFAMDALVECQRAFGNRTAWERLLTGLAPEAKTLEPEDFVVRYGRSTGLSPDHVLRALILSGFVVELPF